MRLAVPQALGWSTGQASDLARSLGPILKTCRKLAAISSPAIANVQFLCLDNVISHGADETTDATVAPNPNRTNSDGSAQHNSVLSDVKSDKYPRTPLARTEVRICFSYIMMIHKDDEGYKQYRELCKNYATNIINIMLSRRLAAIVLLMPFIAANTASASVCEIYCACAVEKNADHQYQSETGLSSLHHHHPTAQLHTR